MKKLNPGRTKENILWVERASAIPSILAGSIDLKCFFSFFSIAGLTRQTQAAEANATKLEKELFTLRNDRAEQSKLIKKFQRKLLLVTKVRDFIYFD